MKILQDFFVKTAGITTRPLYNNIEKILYSSFFFWSIISFFFSVMNLSNFALNLISSKVTDKSFTVLCRTF